MNEFFKYLTVSEEDKSWGLFLNVAGTSRIKEGSIYPPREHPSGYYFNWSDGRVLPEYQINYITDGAGIFENKYGRFSVKPGSIIFTFPGIWHRYKPLMKTGWTENYIGFEGKIATELFGHPLFNPKQPVIQIGIKEEILDTYLKIFDLVEKEKPGFQQVASGMVMKLLGYIISFEKRKGFSGKGISKVIEEARFILRQKTEQEIDLEKLAENYNVSYSHFRQMFKKYTGVSPGQYHLQLKIIRSKELLVSTNKSIKEISHELGFQSIYYFSNLFKKKEGVNPSEFRKGRT
jgi:AraC-like DNA-binding protein